MIFNRIPSISTKELEQKLTEKIELVDVREAYEFTNGHIPRAKNVPLGKINQYKSTGTVYLICQSGMRSKRAAKMLKANGCDVVNVKGGMSAWSGKTRGGKI